MARDLGYNHGASISGFISWLEELGFVEKFKNPQDRVNVYRVSSPVALIKFFSTFRKMSEDRLAINIGENRESVIEYFKKEKGIFCLTTALEEYSEYMRDPAIHVYVTQNYWDEMASKISDGNVRINLYPFKPSRIDNVIEKNGKLITSPVRTLIDLFCDDKAYAAEPLIKQIWTS